MNSMATPSLTSSAADVAVEANIPDQSPACPAVSGSLRILAVIYACTSKSCIHPGGGSKDGEVVCELDLHGVWWRIVYVSDDHQCREIAYRIV